MQRFRTTSVTGCTAIFIEFVQTCGDVVTFHPHVHVLSADGVFRADGTFVPLPAIPEALLARGFRRAVLDFLVREGAIANELRSRMLGWRYSGFSVHVCVAAFETEGRRKLAGCIRSGATMNPFEIDLAGGSMTKHAKPKAKARRRLVYVTIRGKRVKSTPWAARVFRLASKALKGIEVPPR